MSFPDGSVIKNPPANARDAGSSSLASLTSCSLACTFDLPALPLADGVRIIKFSFEYEKFMAHGGISQYLYFHWNACFDLRIIEEVEVG